MSYRISNNATAEKLTERYKAAFADPETYRPHFHLAAFTHPELIMLTTGSPAAFELVTWGFIPAWEKSYANGVQRMLGASNVNREELTTKAAFRDSWKNGQRCLIPATGYFDIHTVNSEGSKPASIPYYIHQADNAIFSIAGIYNVWTDPETELTYNTLSVITVEASPMLKLINNSRQQMPAILSPDTEKTWLDPDTKLERAMDLIMTSQVKMKGHPVYPELLNPKHNSDLPDSLEEYKYSAYSGQLPVVESPDGY